MRKEKRLNRYIKEKAIILIQMGKANEAKEILKQANRDYPDDQEIKTLLVDFDGLVECYNEICNPLHGV